MKELTVKDWMHRGVITCRPDTPVDEVAETMDTKDISGVVGIDRNLRNLAVGNGERVTYYDMSKVVDICENTRNIIGSFRRDDVRIRRHISSVGLSSRRRSLTVPRISGC